MSRSSAHSAFVAMLLFCLVLFAFADAAYDFPKGRRVLLQDSSVSSSGADADSSTSFTNVVTGDDDSPDRVEASPAVALAESPLSDAELCAVSKQIYGSAPPECAGQPQLAVRTLPVNVGPVAEPLSLGVDGDGAITAAGGNPPDVAAADWDPVEGRPLSSSSSSSSSSKLSSGAVAGIAVGAVAVFVAGVAAVAVSRKRRAARSAGGLAAAARAGNASSR